MEQSIETSRGPKRKFESWMSDKIVEIAKEGGHIAQMCIAIGIRSEDTFHRWKKEYPEFLNAYEESKLYSKAFYENLLLKGSAGLIKGFNVTGLLAVMNCKFPDEYKRIGTTNTEITVNNNSLSLSADQLTSKINQQLEKLQAYGLEYKPLIIENENTEEG